MLSHGFANQRRNLYDGSVDECAAISEIVGCFQSTIDVAEGSAHFRTQRFYRVIDESVAVVPKHVCLPLVGCAAYGVISTSDAADHGSEQYHPEDHISVLLTHFMW